MANFVKDPNFARNLQNGVLRALDDFGDEVATKARTYISAYSSSAAKAITKEPARPMYEGPGVVVKIGKGLGRIFEFSKQQPRRTRQGWNRGVMARQMFFNKAKDEVLAKGLNLSRYI